MIRRVSVLAAAAVAVAGSLALAPVATAVPEDPYSITVVGSTDAIDGHVQVTINKPLGRQTCKAIGVPAGAALVESNYVFTGNYTTSSTDPAWSWGFAPVPDGTYDVHWACVDRDDEYWGSFPTVPAERRQEPVQNVRVSHNPNATVGDALDLGSLTSGSADGGFLGS